MGLGLSHLFAAVGCENAKFKSTVDDLANHMGLFLQKTNIIRDYLEDIVEEPAPRMFWPREVWGRYAGELADFKEPKNRCLLPCVAERKTSECAYAIHTSVNVA